jgi:rod shape determining protein RodA
MNRSTIILVVAILIACLGVLSIFSSTHQKEGELWQDIYKRQITWILAGVVLMLALSNFNYRRLWDATYFLYAAMLFLLLLVFILGIVRLGAQRWLRFNWFNIQPSEIAKIIILLFMAKYFSRKSVEDISTPVGRFGLFRSLILPFIFLAVPMLLIIEQPDLGSGLLLLLVFIAVTYLAGVRAKYMAAFLSVLLLLVPISWHFLRSYQKDRLLVFLNPNIDPLGAGYTVIQSRIAIGSAGLFGKGWLSGTQSQLRFLPESHTDFIFATFVEEWGLLGSGVLLILYYLLISEGIRIALKTHDRFGRLLAFGISMVLAIQISINIAMNLGLAPVVGIPLPLMSYGGSSIIVTFISLGILINIDKTRAVF